MPSNKSRAKTPLDAPHTFTALDVASSLDVDVDVGLNNERVLENRQIFGANELYHAESKSLLSLIIAQFEDLLVRILLAAAIVSFGLAYLDRQEDGDSSIFMAYVEPIVILLILIANAIVGVWQECSAEAALESLKKLAPAYAHVCRNGEWLTIPSSEVVVGDVIEVRVGDKVPADARLVSLKNATSIRVEQSSLTGESVSISKDYGDYIVHEADVEIQEKTNLVFSSTTVSGGGATGIVFAVGMNTEIGKIQAAVTDASEEEESTPLSQKLDEFGELLAKVIFVICVLVWVINYKHFFDPIHGGGLRGCVYYFKIAVALAVAAIPEGLPAVITTCLALGTRKMAARNCIVRKLPSVETLGCTTVICSDKTGTLTTNEMCAVKIANFTGTSINSLQISTIEGTSYNPKEGQSRTIKSLGKISISKNFLKICEKCNTTRVLPPQNSSSKWTIKGEPTEGALQVLASKLQNFSEIDNSHVDDENVKTLEFDRDRKSMSVLFEDLLLVKGAPESILDRCDYYENSKGSVEKLSAKDKDYLLAQTTPLTTKALRVLALAYRPDVPKKLTSDKYLSDPKNFREIESNLVFVGFVGLLDPPRPECRDAINECRQAGISVVMITGDNKQTAEAIAYDLGIVDESSNASLTGKEFDKLSESAQIAFLKDHIVDHPHSGGAVFSRTEPKHKQIIVKLLKSLNQITAMTGDGVNDAPALKQADIGIAMGITGTEVAKESADMVLTDDNFSTIVNAVEEGRSIFNNMKAFIRYLISSNIGEVASIFFTAALGIPEGLAPVQLLWVNLVTDGLPATALGFNPADVDVMLKPPRRRDEVLIGGWIFFRYMVIGIYVGIATVGIFIYYFCYDQFAPDGHSIVSLYELMNWSNCDKTQFSVNFINGMTLGDDCSYFTGGKTKASTLSLTVLVVIEMLNALNALSEDGSLFHMPPWANPWLILAIMGSIFVHFFILYIPFLSQVFGVVPLDWHDWCLVLYWSVPVILIDEILKFYGRMLTRKRIWNGEKEH